MYMRIMSEKISNLEAGYYEWARYDKGRAISTVKKHRDCIQVFKKMFGDLLVRQIEVEHFDKIKDILFERKLSRSRVASVIFSMKAFLYYCRDIKGYNILDLKKVKAPSQEKYRIVKTLSKEEIHRVIEDIKLMNHWLF